MVIKGERSLNSHPDPFVELSNGRTDSRNNPHQPNKPFLGISSIS
jgi:hypothetical protein